MANLEYAVPINPSTTFHIASESKQYVAFCMLLLEKEGKLSLDDDIRKHLDFVPDFGDTITIRHLIYHTSGLRDQWQLLANAGWQLDDVITRDHVIKLVSKQTALNFKPGEEWMYCNTGYTLMGEIVAKLSGMSLREYADKNIFKPLQMLNTHFHDNYQELIPGRAYSYSKTDKGFQHAVLSYSLVGATSLHTTVLDEVKWLMNFETGIVGGKDLVQKMTQPGFLNDGRKLTYAFALGLDYHKGWQQVGHGGADAGFRSYACRFPEKDLGVIVFSNLGNANPRNLAVRVADVFITDSKQIDNVDKETNPEDSNFHKRLQGSYYSERGEIGILTWKDGKLYRGNLNAPMQAEIQFLKGEKNRYPTKGGGPVLELDEKSLTVDSIMEMKMINPNSVTIFKRQPKNFPKVSAEFSGRYYNAETEAFYTIVEKDGALTLTHRKFNDVPLKQIAPDQFTSPYWWMSHIRFLRNKKGKIEAFEVNAGRIMHLRYSKVR